MRACSHARLLARLGQALFASGSALWGAYAESEPPVSFPWARCHDLQQLDVGGCPGLPARLLDAASASGLPHLRTLRIAATCSTDATLLLLPLRCMKLRELDVSSNPEVSDHGVIGLARGFRGGALEGLTLERLPHITAHVLPSLADVHSLSRLSLAFTSISKQQQEAALGLVARAERAEAAAAATLHRARDVQLMREGAGLRDAAHIGDGPLTAGAHRAEGCGGEGVEVRRYTPSEMVALQSSAFAQAPPRGMPNIACVTRMAAHSPA